MTERQATFYVSDDKLEHFAENSAKLIELSKLEGARCGRIRLSEQLKNIRSSVRMAEEFSAAGNIMPKPAEWLTDNWYIAEREGKGAMRDLKNIKLTRASDTNGTPLVLYAARELVRSGAGEVTKERIYTFLIGFQNAVVLRERELSMFVPALKAALVNELSEVAQNTEVFLKAKKACTISEIRLREEHLLAAAAERAVTSLRLLSSVDISKILEAVNKTEQILQSDPAGIYPLMDDKTRMYYRRKVSELSHKNRIEEYKIAEMLVQLSLEGKGKNSHVGYYMFERPLGKSHKKRNGSIYISLIILTTLFISLLLGFMLGSAAIAIMLFLPISEIVKNITDFFAIKFTEPRHIPKIELKEGIPEEGKTLCVISALLTSDEVCTEYPRLLEEYCLANRDSGKNLLFGILADLPEAKVELSGEDLRRLGIIKNEVEKLGEKYGRFYLFTRGRVYSKGNGRFMGWERKRGAIIELVRFLSGKESGFAAASGDKEMLSGVKYIITLDSDTRIGISSARELVGAMLHPLNTAEIDIAKKIVVFGHGILQPRVSVDLKAANRSDFTRLYAGQGGIDPYGNAAGDVYNDLFDEGSFMGKGIIDISAFDTCLDHRLPENLVLSHDLLEGAYLRAGFAGDVEFTDGYPYKILSYYERLHRWTRGDWQIVSWLFKKVPTEDGGKDKNPINQINKWKIFDNLRRSTVPIASFIVLYAAMFSSRISFSASAFAAVLSTASALLISSAELVFRRDVNTKAKYHSTIISGFGAALTQTLLQLIFLPYQAYVCLHAILTALYRMNISKKNLLSWVTAAESDKKSSGGILFHCSKMYAPILLGAVAILLSINVVGAAIGFFWLISPLCALSLSREKKKKDTLTIDERLFLLRASNEIWKYFLELSGEWNNYLPPDNFQEDPYIGSAERSSPTNIGLALLSALAAMDMGLSGAEKAPEFIEKLITTVEKLPKWKGHLYNWYDNKTLKPLEPPYISAVDSGNLAGSLIALREGLLEKGEEYKSLAERIDKLVDAMDFSLVYDKERQLFYIGLEESGKPTEGWYDLMASEARQTSYIAIAKGYAKKKHWQRLGRVLVSKDNFYGMASWTGTMFEYLMPNLLMPCYENSMLYESMKFCVYVQKKAFSPWGMSESAFFSFDQNLNYQYKAHGASLLALKRGQEKECVISPYSSFLALQMVPKSAISNLKELSRLGMEGRYGFYEAVDFTPVRQLGKKHEMVKCFMVHHLGMSIIAADNAVNDGIMQKRFMRDREMAAYAELLQEKVPLGQVVLKKPTREIPEKQRIYKWQGAENSGEGVSLENPACTFLSNGTYTIALSETGASRSMWRDLMITNFDGILMGVRQGISFFLKIGDETVPLQAMPAFEQETQYSFKFSSKCAEIKSRRDSFSSCVKTVVSPEHQGELRSVNIKNEQSKNIEAELICYFEPVLAPKADFFAHPAFSKLALETESTDGTILIKRRSNGKRKSIYLGFSCDREMGYDTSKETVLGRGGLRQLKNALERAPGGSLGAVLDPCVLARVKLLLKASEETEVRFALCVEDNAEKAIHSAEMILKLPLSSGAARMEEAAKSIGADYSDIEASMDMLRAAVFRREYYKEQSGIESAKGAKEALWRLGISGDIPIITVIADDDKCAETAKKLLKSYKILRKSGFKLDLIFVTNDGADYRRPINSMLGSLLCEMGFENDTGNGVFIADKDSLDEIAAFSCKLITCGEAKEKTVRRQSEFSDMKFWQKKLKASGNINHYFEADGSFVIELNGCLPPIAWSNILTNGRFGYIASDTGSGHMWFLNARENKLNVWKNDLLATEGTEEISIKIDGAFHSVFASADGDSCKIKMGFGFCEWTKEVRGSKIRTTIFVPQEIDARIVIIEVKKDKKPESIKYFTELVFGADGEQNGIYINAQNNTIIVENKGNTEFPNTTLSTLSNVKLSSITKNKEKSGTPYSLEADYEASDSMVLVSGCDEIEKLSELIKPENAIKALEKTKSYWKEKLSGIKLSSPEKALDNYINGWVQYQALASRILGRSSMYQNGGAYGFRDQLQDVLCLAQHHPEIAKEHILRASAHQFLEGDVQHWWHPNGISGSCEKGVRTRCSDDLLWLPFALCRYVEVSGDYSFCKEEIEYLASPQLKETEHERYELPSKSGIKENLFLHSKRALDLALSRGIGEHGLNLMGGGDWNDGFDRIGINGRGESVWLTWFIAAVAERFAALCSELGEKGLFEKYMEAAKRCAAAAEKAWDGKWYARAYFDDGTPIGVNGDDECAIDSIAQSFSAWTSFSSPERSREGIESAVKLLFDRENKLVKLFTPPFERDGKNPGYIMGYVPGVRENGGQYTHAAVWLALGCFKIGLVNEAFEIISALLPLNHDPAVYKAEPYVLAADVYANPQHVGRAGWNWYTGAASWFFSVVEEELLGLKLRGGNLIIEPKIPDKWTGFDAVFKAKESEIQISVRRNASGRILLDGTEQMSNILDLNTYKGLHSVIIEIK